MSTLQQLRTGLGRAWENIAEGWRQLSERAGQALTHFSPVHRGGNDNSADNALVERSASRWSLLAADVIESGNDVVVKLEVPGLEPEAIDVHVEDDVLVVRGEKRVQREAQEGRYHVLECAYGVFERAVPLPTAVDETRASARYRHGVLRVTLPKRATQRSGRIDVSVS